MWAQVTKVILYYVMYEACQAGEVYLFILQFISSVAVIRILLTGHSTFQHGVWYFMLSQSQKRCLYGSTVSP